MYRLVPISAGFLVALVVFCATGAGASARSEIPASRAEITLSFAPVVKKAAPAVVNVYALKREVRRSSSFRRRSLMDPFSDPFFDDFFGMPRERVSRSLGSGVIVDSEGIVVTNQHVVADATQMRVILHDGREFDAQQIFSDDRTDLALLRIDPAGTRLTAIEFAPPRSIEVGDLVLAIGNPFGVGKSVTSGIISATSRTDVGISDFAFFIQTDAAVNPGNSGGALVDMAGRLIGVNTSIVSRSGGSNGIGFAIPVEMVKRIVAGVTEGGTFERSWLGVKSRRVTGDIAKSLGLSQPAGAIILDIWKNGAADRAGLRAEDVILEIDGQKVRDQKGIDFLVATMAPGKKFELRYFRDGREKTINVRAEAVPGSKKTVRLEIEDPELFNGLTVEMLSPATAEKLGRDPFARGVVIAKTRRGSPAQRLGFRPGDLFVQINESEIKTLRDFERTLDSDPRYWALTIDRNGRIIRTRVRR